VHLQVGAFSPTDPLLDPVWDTLAQTGTPVVLHAGHAPVGAASAPARPGPARPTLYACWLHKWGNWAPELVGAHTK
jgi:predicted TIM-barrel fold metal-dependent hydrolase